MIDLNNCRISTLKTVRNTSSSDIGNLKANTDHILFMNPTLITSVKSSDVLSGVLKCYDIQDNLIDNTVACEICLDIYLMSNGIRNISNTYNVHEVFQMKVLWNIQVAPLAIATVRADVIYSDIKTDTVANILNVLRPSIEYIQLGMFAEAAVELRATTPTVFLTRAKLDMYADMISSADALK